MHIEKMPRLNILAQVGIAFLLFSYFHYKKVKRVAKLGIFHEELAWILALELYILFLHF